VILTGNGPSFSAGGDIREMKRQATPEVSEMTIRHEYRRGIQRLTLALFNLEVPVIAAINGHAIGAGLDLACMCDMRIASENAKFAESFVRVGIVPGDGGAWLLQHVIGISRAAEMSFTGDTINAQQALAWNLVSRVVPQDELMTAARELAGRITQNPSHSLRLTKRLMRESLHARLDTILELSATFQAISHKTADHSEAVNAFLEKRPPQFD
jgi:enoyl-CoA hydratase/carnithine racemase